VPRATKTEYQKTKYDPAMIELAREINKHPKGLAQISRETGVSVSCMRNWMTKHTKRPQNVTMEFVARSIGLTRPGWQKV
jgi:lambda repressor-like predicted transcriptional regulator